MASFNDLLDLMARLRAPDGCPWDREQTYETLAPMAIEEAYEVLEAVAAGRPAKLRDELGDLLFQVVFYAQVAREAGDFTIDDVTTAIHDKMVRRHPHVFGDAQADDSAAVLRNWEAIKAAEKEAAGEDAKESSLLDGVSAKAPALMEAHQLGVKAARVGFDWRHMDEIFDKLHEEVEELRQALREKQADETAQAHVREELGDLLLVITNLARHLQVEPETALKAANRKFRFRFRHIEQTLARQERGFDDATSEELEEIWQSAKTVISHEQTQKHTKN
jgi:MazG family protein